MDDAQRERLRKKIDDIRERLLIAFMAVDEDCEADILGARYYLERLQMRVLGGNPDDVAPERAEEWAFIRWEEGTPQQIKRLLALILDDMAGATNRDLAADGTVGDEEGVVWRKIETLAREIREPRDPRG